MRNSFVAACAGFTWLYVLLNLFPFYRLAALLIAICVVGIGVFVHIAASNLYKLFKKTKRKTGHVSAAPSSACHCISLWTCSLILFGLVWLVLQADSLAIEMDELRRVHSKGKLNVDEDVRTSILAICLHCDDTSTLLLLPVLPAAQEDDTNLAVGGGLGAMGIEAGGVAIAPGGGLPRGSSKRTSLFLVNPLYAPTVAAGPVAADASDSAEFADPTDENAAFGVGCNLPSSA